MYKIDFSIIQLINSMNQLSSRAYHIYKDIERHMIFEIEASASIVINGDDWNLPGARLHFSFLPNDSLYIPEAFNVMRANGYVVNVLKYDGNNTRYLIYITRDPLYKKIKSHASVCKAAKDQLDLFMELVREDTS